MYNVTRYFSLTSPAGTFEFTREVPLSHAKLIRDTITASVMGVLIGVPQIRRQENHIQWFRSHVDGPAKDNVFKWYPA